MAPVSGSEALASVDAKKPASVAVAGKVLDNQKVEGEAAVKLIETAASPPVATATRGQNVNTYA
ncbi:MAG: hypothetical protein AAGA56_31610 [Myxococcota bacterium]